MRITQIKAHLIDSDLESIERRINSPYWRIESGNTISWLCNIAQESGDDVQPIYSNQLVKALEEEFKETYGVMHEQLRLF